MIRFKNEGVIDIDAVTTMGVSVKDASAIGYFGTGLKFAIATLLRNGCEVVLYAGFERYEFSTYVKEVRGKEFQFVKMNDEKLGFTTDLGKNWQPWQCYRELASNTLDEGGTISSVGSEDTPEENQTAIYVSGYTIDSAYEERSTIVLDTQPIHKFGNIEVHEYNGYNFYKGIRVAEVNALYTYNVLCDVALTEDRTLSSASSYERIITDTIIRCASAEFIEEVIQCLSKDKYEEDFYYSQYITSACFDDVVTTCLKNKKTLTAGVMTYWRDRGKVQMFSDPCELNEIETKQLAKAITFSGQIGYTVDEYPIEVCDSLGTGVLGRAYKEKIYISRLVFGQGTKQLAATLIEEFIHLKHGVSDLTYTMQTLLFNEIVSLGERVVGEPV